MKTIGMNVCRMNVGMLVILTALLFSGCVEKEIADSGLSVKIFSISNENVSTRAVMDISNSFSWSEGDIVNYYCTSSQTGPKATTSGSASMSAGVSSKLSMTYARDNEEYVAIYYRGSNVNGQTAIEIGGEELILPFGVPALQKGDVESNMICIGYANILTDESVSLKHMQSFLRLRFSSVTVGKKTVTSVRLTSKDDSQFLAGDMQVNPKEKTAALGSGNQSKFITVTPEGGILPDRDYYVAIAPQTYSSGLRLTLLSSDEEVGYVDMSSVTVGCGKILVLGLLNPHTTVIGKSASFLCGNTTFLTPGMTKKLYVGFSPSDVTRCTWSVTGEKDESGADVPTGTNASIVTQGEGMENINGTNYFVTTLTLTSCRGSCNVNVTLEGNTSPIASCTVNIGDFVDLGLDVLWARSNLNETVNGLCANEYDYGGLYMWGYTDTRSPGTEMTGDMYLNRWQDGTGLWVNGEIKGGKSGYPSCYPKGGKYYSKSYSGGDDKEKLDNEDDAAYQASDGEYRIPTEDELNDLIEHTSMISGKSGSIEGYFLISTVPGYEDVRIFLPNAGCIEPSIGDRLYIGTGGSIWTSNILLEDIRTEVNVANKYGTSGVAWYVTLKPYSCAVRLAYGINDNIHVRFTARSIRPVKEKN